jgi:hypothetical protein
MNRTKITLELNLDEVIFLSIAVMHAISKGWSSEVIKAMYPNADITYLMKQIAIARNEVEDAQ